MIVGWAFVFLIEGACGFGTPAALAAPMLVALGFPPIRVALLCLIFNAIPTAFGAVGTPMWFGFELLELPQNELIDVGAKTALLQSVAALIIPVVSLRFVVDWDVIRRNLVFVYLSILSCVVPMLIVAWTNYEFPAVIGGVVGLVATILLAKSRVGMERAKADGLSPGPLMSGPVLVALTPLIVTVVILLVTRIPVLGLRGLLTSPVPNLQISLGGLGELAVSASLVVQLRNILGQGLAWSHAVLYVPSIIPFLITAVLAFCSFAHRPPCCLSRCARRWHASASR
jgi:lactate permease